MTSRWTSCRVRCRRGLTSSGSVIRPLQQIPPRNGRCVSKTHTLVAVAEELSLTKAAQKLHLAQPSLTRQVRNLEEEIGVAAAGSSQQPVALTGEGRFFLSEAKRLLSMCAESVDAVQRMNRGERSQLNIGYVCNLHYGLLPATLGAFRKLLQTWH
jgi:DNA-binding transcriptional LysR family regulator